MLFFIDFHEHLVQMPASGFHCSDTALFDLGSEERPEPLPLVPHRLMADVDTPLVEQILDVALRHRKNLPKT
jgi:hypothetical protein